MRKPWSLSTTVRNPERILPFLKTLSEMEGEMFDEQGQIKFQILLIKNRLYRPNNLPEALSKYYESKDDTMTYEQAREIFDFMLNHSETLRQSPGLRGRTSVSPLTQKGLAIAKQTIGPVKITDLGKEFLEHGDIGDVFLSYFVKWQIPNPLEDYLREDGFNIKPFLATLMVIKKVNERMETIGKIPKGISKKEFSLFIPTLITHLDIDSFVQKIVELRLQLEGQPRAQQAELFSDYRRAYLKSWLDTNDENEIERNINNLKDYGDSILRNFKLTRYLYIRGRGYYIDLEPRRMVEIEQLLSEVPICAEEFENEDQYINYLSDTTVPTLPWNRLDNLKRVIRSLYYEVNTLENQLGLNETVMYSPSTLQDAKNQVDLLREKRRELQEKLNHLQSQQLEVIEKYIDSLSNIYSMDDRSLMLEKYSTLSLHSLNDSLSIKPNYSVGDDNEPIFTAPAGTPDIECYYDSFNAICEVTMLTSRDQWYNEGQPVMRHLRDFEDEHPEKEVYCLFIAPSIHRDTINTFWNSVKYGFEGRTQKIIPMTIANFLELMKVLVEVKRLGKEFSHSYIKKLYDEILKRVEDATNSEEWQQSIPDSITHWRESII